jgi:hypothetical protein
VLLALPVSAHAAVYWVGGPALGLVNQDGSYPTYFWGRFAPSGVDGGCGVAVDAQHIYWADKFRGVVGRSELDGTDAELSFIAGANEPCGVAVDATHIYWANFGGSIGRARIDGSEVEQSFVSDLGHPCGVAVNDSNLYWTDLDGTNSIGRADIDGKNVTAGFVEGGACGVAVDAEHVFWSTLAKSIGRANLDGSMANDEFIGGLERPCGIASDGTHVYWAEQGSGGPGWVAGANVDGTAVNRNLSVGLIGHPCGVAVDSAVFAPQPPRPAAHFSFGKVRHGYKKGFAFIPVAFPAGGTAEIVGDGRVVSARFLPEGNTLVTPATASVKWIKLSVNRRTAAGRRALRRLVRSGKLDTSLGIFYSEEGRYPAWSIKALKLLRRPARR